MMLLGPHFSRRNPPGTISQPVHSTPVRLISTSMEKQTPTALAYDTLPTWATQALCDLTQGEQELQELRERQTSEVDDINRGLNSAILGAQREERHLLERVERDHRDAQKRLEQLKRENAAAARVGQSLLDRQLRKMNQLREQIHMWGRYPSGPNKSQLLRGVRELIQPWEISLSLKKVSFQPSSQPMAIGFGEITVEEHSLSFPVGVCGPQGKKCAIHSGDMSCENHVATSEQLIPAGGGVGTCQRDSSKTNSGNTRVVRKIRISSAEEDVLGEEVKLAGPKLWPCKRDTSESSQDEDVESLGSDSRGDDLFLAIRPASSQGESEGETSGLQQNGLKRRSFTKGQRKHKMLVPVSSQEPSCPPEESGPESIVRSRKEQKHEQRGNSRYKITSLTNYGGFQSSSSCVDLSSKEHPHLGSWASRRSPSPADSTDSRYTFTIRSANDRSGSLKKEHRRSISSADLYARSPPLTNSRNAEHQRSKWGHRNGLGTSPSNSELNPKAGENVKNPSTLDTRASHAQHPLKGFSEGSNRVGRSLSMSAIEGKAVRSARMERIEGKHRKDRVDSGLTRVEEEKRTLKVGHLVKKFGKQGSGRSDFTLPSGVHATPQGQLFVVDCGNARVQVTDLQRNVVQQVSPPASEGSARLCRNFFDVAANAKGLIALTCAAERALLVFSRHGRMLQTFGGAGAGAGAAPPDLEAPRGVTVTRLDEFLVADIRRGTLTALKLDPKTGAKLERTVVTGFHRPYLVAACMTSGLMVVSERGNETGRAPCIRVLEPGWNTIRILGVCSGMGPVLSCPWGICIDGDGDVLVADWGKQHRIALYPSVGVGRAIVTQGLSSPRGLAVLPEGHLVVSDSMNHCIKIYRYK